MLEAKNNTYSDSQNVNDPEPTDSDGKEDDFRTPINTMTMEMGGMSFHGRQGVQRVLNNIF